MPGYIVRYSSIVHRVLLVDNSLHIDHKPKHDPCTVGVYHILVKKLTKYFNALA